MSGTSVCGSLHVSDREVGRSCIVVHYTLDPNRFSPLWRVSRPRVVTYRLFLWRSNLILVPSVPCRFVLKTYLCATGCGGEGSTSSRKLIGIHTHYGQLPFVSRSKPYSYQSHCVLRHPGYTLQHTPRRRQLVRCHKQRIRDSIGFPPMWPSAGSPSRCRLWPRVRPRTVAGSRPQLLKSCVALPDRAAGGSSSSPWSVSEADTSPESLLKCSFIATHFT